VLKFGVFTVVMLLAVFGVYLSMATYYNGDFTAFFSVQVQHFTFHDSLFDIVVMFLLPPLLLLLPPASSCLLD